MYTIGTPLHRHGWLVVLLVALVRVDCATAQQAVAATLPAAVELTQAERSWLAAGHTVRARVADSPPYMLTKPTPSGIAVDHLASVANRFGFKVEFIADSLGFPAGVQDVAGPRRHYDVLLTFTRTPERERQFAVSMDYLTAPWVVYAREDSPYIIGLESLGGKTVVGERGYVITHRITVDYPSIHVFEVPKTEDALFALATGAADAYVGNLANASYLVKANHLDNLVVTAATRYGINAQAMAVRRDWPELAALIDKGIAAMAPEERIAISQKWGSVEFRPRIDYTLIWQVVAISALIVLAFLYWNRKLAREITLRKRVEDDLRIAKDLAESANRAKTNFLANMSHELRTPMNGVMGMTELALRRATDPRQIDWLNKSRIAAHHLIAVINDILDISKIEADRVTLKLEDFALAQMIDDILRMQEAAAAVKGLQLSREIDPSLPGTLRGDVMRLRQILINFIGNAIKFSDHGLIEVRARLEGSDRQGVSVRIEVSDQGIGISPEQQAQLFHAFTQADVSTTRKYGGTGLGLVISKRLAMLMGGDAGVDSTPGIGSTFWFTVRLAAATPYGASAAPPDDS